MKYFLAVLLILVSLSARAVDITITLNAEQATRAAAACGKALGLTTGGSVPRPCTMAEAKTFLINLLRQVVLDSEQQTARQAITVPSFDPQ